MKQTNNNQTTKELLTIEFRYHDRPKFEGDGETRQKTITIGIFDTLEEAVKEGNKALEVLSKHFQVRPNDKFQEKCTWNFGYPLRTVSNCCYSTRGIQYFAKITPLKFDDLSATIKETFEAADRCKAYREEMGDD